MTFKPPTAEQSHGVPIVPFAPSHQATPPERAGTHGGAVRNVSAATRPCVARVFDFNAHAKALGLDPSHPDVVAPTEYPEGEMERIFGSPGVPKR